ncbi:Sec-independent protein translocase subunit TatA [Corynebacterium sp. A21]|uniref:Sec-independent protein translocase subunit TatA n=1 Tax=Corynebacterium sp. A21 TaxID=3457318 RepID=UPI003FD44569
MPTPGIWEILIIAVVVILLFGAKKLPDAARSIGRSMRIFKSEVKEMGSDGEKDTPQQGQLPQAQPEPDFWERPENQPNAQQNLQQPPAQQQPNPQQHPNQSN